MHTSKKVENRTSAPSRPLTVNINGDAKSFHVGNTAVWYGQIPNVIARMNPSITKQEICYYLSWSKLHDGSKLNGILNEFIRTVEYQTAMISKYKHEQTIQVEEDDMNHTYLVTFIPTSCY